MGSYDTNLRRGVFRSGELNTESTIPSLGGFPEAGASDIRSEAAMRGAAARIVEIGGQFDTQHLLDPVVPSPNLKQVTAAGNALRERAARFPCVACEREPQGTRIGAEWSCGAGWQC